MLGKGGEAVSSMANANAQRGVSRTLYPSDSGLKLHLLFLLKLVFKIQPRSSTPFASCVVITLEFQNKMPLGRRSWHP